MDALETFAREHGLPWGDKLRERYAEYLDLLEQFNDSMNLIGPMSRSEIVRDLFVDSLVPATLRAPHGPILDVGTGAGLPGIPLKLAYPDCPVTLVEPRRKRSTFLKIATNRLDLDGVTLERTRIEELDPAPFDYVASKALQPPAEWLETAAPFRADDGAIVCLTTPEERTSADQTADGLDLRRVATLDDVSTLEGVGDDKERAVFVYGRSS
jgi:16S rRNA (guanine527-N7)-methyltransferase